MTFQQLSYLVEISKCGSINKAAQKLFLSQSGISIAIKELEEELGITFFVRTNKGVTFTAEGREFLSHAISLLENKAQIEKLYGKNRESTALTYLSISTQRYPFAEDAFIRLIKKFNSTRYRLELFEKSMDAVIDDVFDHRSELGVIFLTDLTSKVINRLLDSRGLEFHELADVESRVFCRKGHPLTKLKKLTEEDLADFPYLSFEHAQGVSIDFSEECQLLSMKKPLQRIIINSRESATDIIANSDAVTTGSGLMTKGISNENVISMPLSDKPNIRLGWISAKTVKLSPIASEYIKYLNDSIKDSIEYTKQLI